MLVDALHSFAADIINVSGDLTLGGTFATVNLSGFTGSVSLSTSGLLTIVSASAVPEPGSASLLALGFTTTRRTRRA